MANDYTLKEKGIIRADATKIYPSVDAMYGPWASVEAFRTYLGSILGGTVTDDIIPNSVEIGIIQEDGTVKRYEWQKPTNGQGSWVESGGGAVASVNGKTGVVVLNKSDIGLGNVDNTSDVNKPISTATQTALNAKANASDLTAHTGSTSNPHGVTKAQVGLGNVDNTADADKIVKRATEDGSGNVITSTYETKTDAQSKITNLASDVADTYQTKTDAASAHSNIQGQVTTLSNTVANLTGLDGTNFGGFSIQQSDSLAVAGITTLFSQMGYTAGDTYWFLAGTSMASLKAYRFDGVQTDPVLISNDVYDFTDFSGLQTKVDKFKGTTNDIDSLNSGSDAGVYFYISASKMGLVSVAYDATHSVVTQHWLSDMTPDATDPAVLNEGPAILMRTYKNSAWSAWQNPIGELAAQVAAFGPKLGEPQAIPITGSLKRIDLSVGIGNTVNLTPAASAYSYSISDITEGDTLIINGTGGSGPRLWGIIDSQNKLLAVANDSATASNLKIVAPQNSSKLIINDNTGSTSYIVRAGKVVVRVDDIVNDDTTGGADKVASAEIVKTLSQSLDAQGDMLQQKIDEQGNTLSKEIDNQDNILHSFLYVDETGNMSNFIFSSGSIQAAAANRVLRYFTATEDCKVGIYHKSTYSNEGGIFIVDSISSIVDGYRPSNVIQNPNSSGVVTNEIVELSAGQTIVLGCEMYSEYHFSLQSKADNITEWATVTNDDALDFTPSGYYIGLNYSVGDVCTKTATSSTASWGYKIIPCSEGDEFTITTFGNSNIARSFAVLDKNDVVLYVTSSFASSNRTFVVPKDGRQIIVNSNTSGGTTVILHKRSLRYVVSDLSKNASPYNGGYITNEKNISKIFEKYSKGSRLFLLDDIVSDGFANNYYSPYDNTGTTRTKSQLQALATPMKAVSDGFHLNGNGHKICNCIIEIAGDATFENCIFEDCELFVNSVLGEIELIVKDCIFIKRGIKQAFSVSEESSTSMYPMRLIYSNNKFFANRETRTNFDSISPAINVNIVKNSIVENCEFNGINKGDSSEYPNYTQPLVTICSSIDSIYRNNVFDRGYTGLIFISRFEAVKAINLYQGIVINNVISDNIFRNIEEEMCSFDGLGGESSANPPVPHDLNRCTVVSYDIDEVVDGIKRSSKATIHLNTADENFAYRVGYSLFDIMDGEGLYNSAIAKIERNSADTDYTLWDVTTDDDFFYWDYFGLTKKRIVKTEEDDSPTILSILNVARNINITNNKFEHILSDVSPYHRNFASIHMSTAANMKICNNTIVGGISVFATTSGQWSQRSWLFYPLVNFIFCNNIAPQAQLRSDTLADWTEHLSSGLFPATVNNLICCGNILARFAPFEQYLQYINYIRRDNIVSGDIDPDSNT